MAKVATELGLQDSESDNNDRTAAAAVVVAALAENEEVSTPDVSASYILCCTGCVLG